MMKAFVITVLVVSILKLLFCGLMFLAALQEQEEKLLGKSFVFGGLSALWIIGAIVALCVG